MIVLSEAYLHLESPSADDLIRADTAAREAGCQVFAMPTDFSYYTSPSHALSGVPDFSSEEAGAWIGFIPGPERYQTVYAAALAKKIRLLNTPEQYQRVQEFDKAYPFIQGITPQTLVVTDAAQCLEVMGQLGAPVFVKGAVQSLKQKGLKACIANNVLDLVLMVQELLDTPGFSNGRVLVRRMVPLRKTGQFGDFPKGREYRAFVLNRRVIGLGYYWAGEDPFGPLTEIDQERVNHLASAAAEKLEVPYVSVDMGQCEDGSWTVIETGDAQFTSVGKISLTRLWQALNQSCSS
ncbi:MAG: ATP-grasp domain-containing protein [Candidatus Sericytochromatia bacterium]